MTKHTIADAPRAATIVQGISVSAPHVYAEGHALTTSEAGFLNRSLVNKVGSQLGQKIKNAADKANVELSAHLATLDMQSEFDSAFANFDMDATRGSGSGTSVDPVAKRAYSLAEVQFKLLPKVQSAGVGKLMKAKRADGSSQWAFLITNYLATRPDITELAKSQIEAERAIGVPAEPENFDDLFDGAEVASEAPAAAE